MSGYQSNFGGYGQPYHMQSYNPMPNPNVQQPYNSIAQNEQRMQNMIQANPQLANQFVPPIQPNTIPQQPIPFPLGKVRKVSGIDEAKAAQIDFDGSHHFFINEADKEIYNRYLGQNGLFVFDTYILKIEEPKNIEESKKIEEISISKYDKVIDDLQERIKILESRVKMEEQQDGTDATDNAISKSITKQRKSLAIDATDGK